MGVPWCPPGTGLWETGTWLLKQHCQREIERERDIYIYICCGVINWSKLWGFSKFFTGPSLFFSKHCLSKNTIQIGVSAHFFSLIKLRAQIFQSY